MADPNRRFALFEIAFSAVSTELRSVVTGDNQSPTPASSTVPANAEDAKQFHATTRIQLPERSVEEVGTVPVRIPLQELRECEDEQSYGRKLTEAVFYDRSVYTAFARVREVADFSNAYLRIRIVIAPNEQVLHGIKWELLGDPSTAPNYWPISANERRQPKNSANRKKKDRLPTVAELYPEILKRDKKEEDQPSCSAREALTRQEPFINQNLAYQALGMLTQLLRHGSVSYQGGFCNIATGQLAPLPVREPPRFRQL